MHFMHAYNLLLCVSSFFLFDIFFIISCDLFGEAGFGGAFITFFFCHGVLFFSHVSGQAGFGGELGFFLWYGYLG